MREKHARRRNEDNWIDEGQREKERKWRNNPSTSILMDAVNRNSGQVQAL